VFNTPKEKYGGAVTGWDASRTDRLVVRFDDGDTYWFPLQDVKEWIEDNLARGRSSAASPAAAGLQTPVTPASTSAGTTKPRQRRTQQSGTPASPRSAAGTAVAGASAGTAGAGSSQLPQAVQEQQQQVPTAEGDMQVGLTIALALLGLIGFMVGAIICMSMFLQGE